MIVIGIIYNLCAFIAISILTGLVNQEARAPWRYQVVQGIIFGTAAILGMLHSLVLSPGIIFDGRSIMVSLCGLFFGPLAVGVAGGMAILFRIVQGGTGALTGVLVVLSSALLGVGFYFLQSRRRTTITLPELWMFGLLVHVVLLGIVFMTLPFNMALDVLKRILFPALLVYPLAVVLIGKIFLDISERKRVENDWRLANRALRTISECNQVLVRATDEATLLDGVCRHLVEHGGYRLAWVGFAEQDETRSVRPVAQAGFEEGYLEALQITWADTERGRGPTGTAIRTGKHVIARNILTDPAFGPWRQAAVQCGYASSIALPLVANGETCGALMLYAAVPDAFNADEVALLTELANDLVYGITALRTRTAHEQAEMSLRESERKYRELVENANSIILHWTRDGRIIFLNEFGQRFFGYTEAEIIGRHVIGTIVPETETSGRDLHTLMDEICANPVAFEQNVNENIRSNGERIWVAWTNKIVLDAQGRVAEILSIGLDVTANKRIEEELRQTKASLEQRVIERTAELSVARDRAEAADRTKSVFLATMSHELRTPLNSIIGFTGLLLKGLAGPLNEEQAKQLGMVKGSGQHLLALINDVLDISKIEAGELEIFNAPFSLRESVQKVVQTVTPLADKKQLSLVAQISPDVTRITSDRRRVEQILLNLLSNSIKFSEQGRVTLTVEMVSDIRSSAFAAVRISVADTGMGIKRENLGKLFQPFHQLDTGLTRQHEGTGLGLVICKRLAERLGGTIEVKSEWGKGSTFRFTLPIHPERNL